MFLPIRPSGRGCLASAMAHHKSNTTTTKSFFDQEGEKGPGLAGNRPPQNSKLSAFFTQ
jgi:hypothetical protein